VHAARLVFSKFWRIQLLSHDVKLVSLFTVVCVSRYVVTALDEMQPVTPLADDPRGSTTSQSSASRPKIIDDSERSVISSSSRHRHRHRHHGGISN